MYYFNFLKCYIHFFLASCLVCTEIKVSVAFYCNQMTQFLKPLQQLTVLIYILCIKVTHKWQLCQIQGAMKLWMRRWKGLKNVSFSFVFQLWNFIFWSKLVWFLVKSQHFWLYVLQCKPGPCNKNRYSLCSHSHRENLL